LTNDFFSYIIIKTRDKNHRGLKRGVGRILPIAPPSLRQQANHSQKKNWKL